MLAAISLDEDNAKEAFRHHPDMAEYLHSSDFEKNESYEYLAYTTFISFDINNLISLRKICPNQKAQYLTVEFSNEILENLKKYKLDLDIEYHNINNDILQILKENNIEVNCWTCNDSEDGEKLVECGVDYITSNILE